MQPSESARMTTAHETQFRVQRPNSTPRAIKVVALDRAAGAVVKELAAKSWNRAVFFDSLAFPETSAGASSRNGMTLWLSDIAGHAREMVAEIDSADIVVVVASAGTDASQATAIGEACRLRHKSMIGLMLESEGASDAALTRTLSGLRPFTTMLVVASGLDYVEAMLVSMRA